jgi:hypothetical protein
MSRIDSGERTRLAFGKGARFQGFVDEATLVEFVADKACQALDDFMGNGAAIRLATRRLRPKAVPDFPVDAVIPSNIPHRERHQLPDDRNSL